MTFKIAPVICSIVSFIQHPVGPTEIDLQKYSGKWYVIGTIPTRYDKDWNYITETYTMRSDGDIDIYTTYRKKGDKEIKDLKSKGFPISEQNNLKWKVQFIWPFKVDYLIEELADDYSYVVVGHPKQKFLYIMSRNPQMDTTLYASIVERCHQKGYDIAKIRKPLQ
ncbi:MAG: lipocalin family protein [Bacteroidetes bacterium]|nr:lipocalin family protein [Bacteroidota bacterium]